jgi:DNA-binding GntR family transcriptional regulator
MARESFEAFLSHRKPPTLAEHVTQQLRHAIIQGELEPGTPLILADLAKKLDVSIMPVREALKRLQSEGLIEQPPQKEARVAPLSLLDLDDTYATRILLETRVIRRAAEKFTADDYQRLSQILAQYEAAYASGSELEGQLLHRQFHFGLYELGASPWLLRLLSMLWDNSDRYRAISLTHRGSISDRRAEHEAILTACLANQPDQAGQLLELHLRRTATLVYEAAKAKLDKVPASH